MSQRDKTQLCWLDRPRQVICMNTNRSEPATDNSRSDPVKSATARARNKPTSSDTPPLNRGSRSRERTRRKLIEAAHKVIATKGFDSATIDDITNGADVGAGTFYNHFTSKEDITNALFKDRAEEIGRIVDEINAQETDKAIAITYIQKVFLTRALHDPVWGWFIVRTQGTHQYMKTFYFERAVQDIKTGTRQGRFTISAAATAARITLSALVGAMRSLLEGDAPEHMAEQTVECLMRMYGLSEDESKRISQLPLPDYVLALWEERTH